MLINTFKRMLILPDINEITYFSTQLKSYRTDNDHNNKIREKIIETMSYIDDEYFNDPTYGTSWRDLKTSFDLKMNELCNNYHTYKIKHKAGRKFNYDFINSFYDSSNVLIKNVKLEFKFNASSIDQSPQFVSPMRPSQYLSQSFEEFYYTNYLSNLFNKYQLSIPDLDTYIKTIHKTNPKCMNEAQLLYYQGCKTSSKYTETERAINFYNDANIVSRECIYNFITNTDLDIDKLNQYLIQSQEDKIYLLYKNNSFNLQYSNSDDYIIENYEKQPDNFRYLANSKSNKKIKILLRWKNGNGIAFPAFQIS